MRDITDFLNHMEDMPMCPLCGNVLLNHEETEIVRAGERREYCIGLAHTMCVQAELDELIEDDGGMNDSDEDDENEHQA
jgi:hypothetical protein